MCFPTNRTAHTQIADIPVVAGTEKIFNNALNTFYLWIHSIRHMVKDHIMRGNHFMDYSLQLAASHRQDSTYHILCCTSCGALAGT